MKLNVPNWITIFRAKLYTRFYIRFVETIYVMKNKIKHKDTITIDAFRVPRIQHLAPTWLLLRYTRLLLILSHESYVNYLTRQRDLSISIGNFDFETIKRKARFNSSSTDIFRALSHSRYRSEVAPGNTWAKGLSLSLFRGFKKFLRHIPGLQ